jgi:prophage tail gpP-like protein
MNSLVVTLPESKISITGWKGARVTRSIESCTGSFVLEMTERFPEEVDEASLIGGAAIQIAIDADNILLTGYVDTVEYIITPHEHLVRATGRGKCQDLIDCSAPVDRILANSRIDAVCRSLLKNFEIDVVVSASLQAVIGELPTIPFQLISITETPWEIIERCCRYSGVLAFELEDGSLCLALAGDVLGSTGLEIGKNVESAVSVKSSLGRFSSVSGVLTNYNNATDIGVNLLPEYTAYDPGVKRYRPRFIVSEQPSSDRTYLERRVDWQIARAYGMSRQVRVLVDSWTDSSGSPWYLNYQVPVTMPLLKIPEKTLLLITEISFILDENGTHTELLLAPRQAYLPEPLVLQRIDPDIAPA